MRGGVKHQHFFELLLLQLDKRYKNILLVVWPKFAKATFSTKVLYFRPAVHALGGKLNAGGLPPLIFTV